MALRINWIEPRWYANKDNPDDVVKRDVSYPEAYVAVTEYDGRKSTMSFVATVYADETKEEIVVRSSHTIPHSVEDDAPNIVRQAYLHLKTLPEFAGAEDC